MNVIVVRWKTKKCIGGEYTSDEARRIAANVGDSNSKAAGGIPSDSFAASPYVPCMQSRHQWVVEPAARVMRNGGMPSPAREA
jgi:hypothetical protein